MNAALSAAALATLLLLGPAVFRVDALAAEATQISLELEAGKPAVAPLGFQLFCLMQPTHCRSDGADRITTDTNLLRVISAVNQRVNRAIRPLNDASDKWSLNPTFGDCEDYALSKRAALINRGFGAGALRIATAYTVKGEGHAVLIVRTNVGDLVLDNRSDTIKPWHETDLSWVAISGKNPLEWQSVRKSS